VPSSLRKVTNQDRAKVKPSVGLQQPPRTAVERVQSLVEGGEGFGSAVEIDIAVACPDPELSATGQMIRQPLRIVLEAGTAMNGNPAGQSVLRARQPLAPELPHTIIVVPGDGDAEPDAQVLQQVRAGVVSSRSASRTRMA
jgi:hypothetical protein